jgi:hypothetical protein
VKRWLSSYLCLKQNKYYSLVKDEIVGMLMIEGCDSEGLIKNYLKNEYKINGKIDCYPTTSSKAVDLIDSCMEVGGNNNNKTWKSTGNDNDEEQIAGIHATDAPDDESLNKDDLETKELPDELPDEPMIAALAAVQDDGQEDLNYYAPLDTNDIDFEIDFGHEEVAGIHVVVEVQEDSEAESSSESSSYHLSDHYYCPSDDNLYVTSSSDDDKSSNGSSMPGLNARAAEYSSSDDEDSQLSVDNNEDDDSISLQGGV